MKSKIIGKHIKDCFALKRQRTKKWSTCWSTYPDEIYFGDTIGRRRGASRVWLRFVCNNTDCKCFKIVSGDECARIK